MLNNLSQVEKDKCISALSDLPPLIWMAMCKTQDQQEHWVKVKSFFTFLQSDLNGYFSGQKSTDIPQGRKEEIKLWRERYIKFYDLIYEGWDELIKYFEDNEIPLPSNPGNLLILNIKELCKQYFDMCQAKYEEWSVRKAYEDYRKSIKIREILSKELKSCNVAEKRLYNDFKRSAMPILSNPNLETICLMALRTTKSPSIRAKIKAFLCADDQVNLFYYSMISPKKKVPSFAWKDGVKLKGNSKGVYTA